MIAEYKLKSDRSIIVDFGTWRKMQATLLWHKKSIHTLVEGA
jgi:hypothetical protein